MKVHPLIKSFSAGEISPLVFMREDLPAVQNGTKQMKNMFPDPRGAVMSRRGSKFIAMISEIYDIDAVMFIPFVYGSDTQVLLAFVCAPNEIYKIYVITEDGLVTGSNLVPDPKFEEGPAVEWTVVVEYNGGTATFLYPGMRLQVYVPNKLLASCIAAVNSTPFNVAAGDYYVRIKGSCSRPTGFTAAAPTLQIIDNATSTILDTLTAVIDAAGNFDTTISLNLASLTAVRLYLALSCNTDANFEGESIVAIVEEVIIRNTVDSTNVEHDIPPSVLPSIQGEMLPGANTMYLVGDGTIVPKYIDYNETTDTWTFGNVSFTSQPAAWVALNYPSMVTFFQGRSWWAGVAAAKETIWASKSAAYADMTTGTLADSALSYTLTRKGAIRWLKGANNLVVGTTNTEYIITSESGLIAADGGSNTPQARAQSKTGSGNVDAVDLGNRVLFVNGSRSRVFDMGYKWEEDKWIARDISFISEHLLSSEKIRYLALLNSPERKIAVLTHSGKLFMAIYDDLNSIIGWCQHPVSRSFLTMTVINQNDKDRLMLGSLSDGSLVVEEFNADYCLDQYAIINNKNSSSSVSVPHLASRTVQVIADDVVLPDVTLDSSGDGDIGVDALRVVLGLQLSQTLEILPFGYSSVVGSGLGQTKRWSKIFLRLYKSYIPKINGVRPRVKRSDFNYFEENDQVEDGFIEVSQLGWSKDGTIVITQDEPRYVCITGIYGELDQNRID